MFSLYLQRTLDYVRYLSDLLFSSRVGAEKGLASRRDTLVTKYAPEVTIKSVLDLANGRLRPQYTILRRRGVKVVGIDLVNYPKFNLQELLYKLARLLFRIRAGGIRSRDSTLVCGDVNFLPFRKESFDLVTSIAAFEHFLDVPSVINETARVLNSKGILFIVLHPFTALSGGHNISLRLGPIQKLPRGVDAWDHLRRRKISFSVPLNEWRIQQYLEAIGDQFAILHTETILQEGKAFLTSEIQRELSEFSEEELLTASFLLIAQKKV